MEIILSSLFALSSFGFLASITLYGRVNFSLSPFIYISFIIVFLYLSALINLLHAGSILLIVFGIALSGLVLHKKRTELMKIFKLENVYYLLILLPVALLTSSIPSNYMFTEWDVFSFWGSSIKFIHDTHSLYTTESPIVFKWYPPAQQLFQYYFTKFSFWSESNLITAQIIFVFSSLLCVTGSALRVNSILGVVVYFASSGLIYFFGYTITTILVDLLLSVYFAAALSLAYNLKNNFASVLIMIMTLITLVLIKQIGLILALFVMGVYATNIVFAYINTKKHPIEKKNYIESLLKTFVPLLLCFTAILFSFKSWDWYVISIEAKQVFSIPPLTTVFMEPMLNRFGLTIIELINRLQADNFIKLSEKFDGFSILHITFFLCFFGLCTILIHPKYSKARALATLSVITSCAALYLIFLFVSYLFFFTAYEGVRLASFERYLSTYFLAWALFLYATFCSILSKYKPTISITALVLVSCASSYFLPKSFYEDINKHESPPHIVNKRLEVRGFTQKIKPHMNKGDKVYFIMQNTTGFEKVIFSYEVLPFMTEFWCWTLGNKYHEGDVWTCQKTLADVLDDYDFLALYRADKQFWDNNGYLFEKNVIGNEMGVFKVNRNADQIVSLSELH